MTNKPKENLNKYEAIEAKLALNAKENALKDAKEIDLLDDRIDKIINSLSSKQLQTVRDNQNADY